MSPLHIFDKTKSDLCARSITATDVAPKMLENLRSRKIPNVTTLILDATKDHVAQGESCQYSGRSI